MPKNPKSRRGDAPKPADELMRVLTTEGLMDLVVKDPEERSLAGKYWHAIKKYLGGDEEALIPFEGLKVAGLDLETNLDAVDYRESEGELDIEIYPSGKAGA